MRDLHVRALQADEAAAEAARESRRRFGVLGVMTESNATALRRITSYIEEQGPAHPLAECHLAVSLLASRAERLTEHLKHAAQLRADADTLAAEVNAVPLDGLRPTIELDERLRGLRLQTLVLLHRDQLRTLLRIVAGPAEALSPENPLAAHCAALRRICDEADALVRWGGGDET